MHSVGWAAAAVWAVVASEVVAGSTPALQAALEDLHLHAHLLLDLPPDLLLLVPSLLAPSPPGRLHPERLLHGHSLLQERTYSHIPLDGSRHSQAEQTGLYVSATDFSLITGLTTTGSSSIADSFHADALAASHPSSLIADFSLVLRSSAGLLLAHLSGILFMTDIPDILATQQTITRRLQPQWPITVITAATLNSRPMSSN